MGGYFSPSKARWPSLWIWRCDSAHNSELDGNLEKSVKKRGVRANDAQRAGSFDVNFRRA